MVIHQKYEKNDKLQKKNEMKIKRNNHKKS